MAKRTSCGVMLFHSCVFLTLLRVQSHPLRCLVPGNKEQNQDKQRGVATEAVYWGRGTTERGSGLRGAVQGLKWLPWGPFMGHCHPLSMAFEDSRLFSLILCFVCHTCAPFHHTCSVLSHGLCFVACSCWCWGSSLPLWLVSFVSESSRREHTVHRASPKGWLLIKTLVIMEKFVCY